jgi:hypothetical protein
MGENMPKKLVSILVALLGLGALVAPTAAYAVEEEANWMMGEAILEEEQKPLPFHGQMDFVFAKGLASIECNVQLGHTLDKKKGQGHVKTFAAPVKECTTAGAFKPCTVSEVKPMNLPWVANAKRNGAIRFIQIQGLTIEFVQTGFLCPNKKPKVNGTVNAFPTLFTSITAEEFNETSGILESTYEKEAFITAKIPVETEEASGTYGIE